MGLRTWWQKVMEHGPPHGYHPNEEKTILVVKPEHIQEAREIFQDTQVKITEEGSRHLGSVIGTSAYKVKFVEDRVAEWCAEIERLAEVAKTQPQAAYSAFTFGIKHRWNFIMKTVPNIEDLLLPLEKTMLHRLIPSIAGRRNLDFLDREIVALPPRLGGMGIPNPKRMAITEHENAKKLTARLTQLIVEQDES